MSDWFKELKVGIFFSAVLILAACREDTAAELDNYIKDIHSRPGQMIEPLPKPKVYEKFRYQPQKRQSPFLRVVQKVEVKKPAPDLNRPDQERPKQPLEAYPLDGLEMVGKIRIAGLDWALVQSSDGQVHRIRKGQYMGKNYGKVIGISHQRLMLEETVWDGKKWKKRRTRLKLRTGDS